MKTTGPFFRDRVEHLVIKMNVNAEQPHGAVKKAFAPRHVVQVAHIEFLEGTLAAEPFDCLDHCALQEGLIGGRIGKAHLPFFALFFECRAADALQRAGDAA